jgi:hypothetical protein
VIELTKEQAGRLANEDSMAVSSSIPVTGSDEFDAMILSNLHEPFIYFHQRLSGWETSVGLLLAS